jgi:hypothetical protein
MTATLPTPAVSKSTSRRALLAGALGGLGAVVATAIGRASAVRAADGDAVTVGGSFTATTGTQITNTSNSNFVLLASTTSGVAFEGGSTSGYAFYGSSSNSGVGVFGRSTSYIGVWGDSDATNQPAILGYSSGNSTGVQGHSGTGNPAPAKAKTGVYGEAAQDGTSKGVWGDSPAGHGVNGTSSSGIGVAGTSDSNSGVTGNSNSYIGVSGGSFATDQPASIGLSVGNSTGVQGYSGSSVVPAAKAKTGVYGYAAQDIYSSGVIGESPAGMGVRGHTTSGYAGYFEGRVYTNAFYELTEVATPATPIANRARLFIKDNGLGKTQVCVKFANGTVKVLATEG